MELASCQYRGGNRQAIALNNYRISSIQVTLKIPDFLVATVINSDKPVEEVGDLPPECWVWLLVAFLEIVVKEWNWHLASIEVKTGKRSQLIIILFPQLR
ncbi:MAG: hypothetical protein F6K47_33345 [Symploca sp. SIO2E6]|nr:hypothetical protein [Symploca sp. SIO2E6]